MTADELVRHVAAVLAEHRRRCRQVGALLPPDLDELHRLVDAYCRRPSEANGGHQRPRLDQPTVDVDPLTMTYEAAGRRLGRSSRTVRRLVAAGAIPTVRIGGRAGIRTADLDTYVMGLKEGSR